MQVDFTVPDWATHVISDLTDMERSPHKVDASKVSKFSVDLPDNAYFEYAFLDNEGELRPDPENPRQADNPWFPGASAVTGPHYVPSPYASLEPTLATGQTERHRLESSFLDEKRRVTVYTPGGFEDAALPCIYVQDGTAYFRLANLHLVLEKLLAEGRVRPAHLVFIEPTERSIEYPFFEPYQTFVKDELFAYVAEHHAVTDERIMMGASLGGLFSATFALTEPGLVAGVVAQSGAFLGTPADKDFYRSRASWVLEALKGRQTLEQRWYLEVGTLEWLTDINRSIRDVLDDKGYSYCYAERNAGHNWTNWRNGLADALKFALQP